MTFSLAAITVTRPQAKPRLLQWGYVWSLRRGDVSFFNLGILAYPDIFKFNLEFVQSDAFAHISTANIHRFPSYSVQLIGYPQYFCGFEQKHECS